MSWSFPNNGGIKDLLKLRRELRRRRYNAILDIHGSLRSRFLTFGLRGVRRVNKRVIARTILVRCKRDVYSLFGGAPGVAERYLETSPVGVETVRSNSNCFSRRSRSRRRARCSPHRASHSGAGAIGICPSARHFTKVWPEERFASVAISLVQQWGAPVILFGGPEDRERCRRISAMIAQASPRIPIADVSGTCTLLESAALMDYCRIVITNDSGLMHIASARKRPVVAIFGSTVRQFGFFPVGTRHRVVEHPGLSCRPCSHIGRSECPRGHFRCMLDLSPAACS